MTFTLRGTVVWCLRFFSRQKFTAPRNGTCNSENTKGISALYVFNCMFCLVFVTVLKCVVIYPLQELHCLTVVDH